MIPLIVKVKPGASRDEITLDAEGNWIIKIRAQPVEGAANAYLLNFLAKEWKTGKSNIILEKGATSRFKKILINTDQASLDKIISRYKK